MSELTKRGSILCQRCGSTREGRSCPKCGHDACLIRISFKKIPYRMYYDRNKTAYSFSTAVQDLIEINGQIKNNKFDPKNWVPEEIEKKRFSHLWGEFIQQKENRTNQGKFAPSSLRAYKSYYRNHFVYFANMIAEEIKLKDIQLFVDGLNVSEKYSRSLIGCLENFFNWLQRWDGTKKPLFPEKETPNETWKTALLYEEQIAAINRIPEQHRDVFMFMREVGLRVSEGCSLKVKDINFSDSKVSIQRTYSDNILLERTKARKTRVEPLSDVAFGIAKKCAGNRFGEEFLFLNPETGDGYKSASLRRYWRLYSGSGKCVHEGIRHSTISDWSRRANAFQVKELAGHSDIRTSQKYVHNALTDLRDIVNRDNVIEMRKVNG